MPRLAGIDYGKARLGLAISDESQILATPVAQLENHARMLQELEKELKPYLPIQTFVIGFPLHLNGKESPLCQEVRLFAEKLSAYFHIPSIFWDERLTTSQVERVLQDAGMSRKKRTLHTDKLAAVLILQSYLDCQFNKKTYNGS